MALLLYINGQIADLEPGQQIAQTKQVNDLNSLDDRQASYTNKFKLPKTAANLKIFNFLTVTGNSSAVPYQKNECSLYSSSGECFVYKGRAVITDGGNEFEAVIYDGIIDLYKAIENKTLAQLTLTEADHDKTVAAVQGSMYPPAFGYPPFTYILADYNGKTGFTPETPRTVNIDYLVPSINVKYLWDKIFNSINMVARGSIFEMESFKDLWLTFPKGVTTADNDTEVFCGQDYIMYNYSPFHNWRRFPLQWATADPNLLVQNNSHIHLKVAETGTYRIEASGSLQTSVPVFLSFVKNAEQYSSFLYAPFTDLHAAANGAEFTATATVQLTANDSLCFYLRESYESFRFNEGSSLQIKLIKTEPNSISFGQALEGLSVKDFLTEVVHRFGLTIYKDRNSNTYDFLTLQEQLQTAAVVSWSDKFVKKASEKYIYGNYAQRNWLRYNYNDKEASHSDYYIDVANENLPETRDAIKSKIYCPEKDIVTFLGHPTRLYKLWEKDPIDNPAPGEEMFKYKPLDKRYYFIKRHYITNQPVITLKSPTLGQSATTTAYNIESFYKLPFRDIVQDYYEPLKQILNRALIITAEMYLTESDIVNFDFRKLYYIEQLSGYFMVNKINNYIPGKVTKCEMVRVQTLPQEETAPSVITITGFEQTSNTLTLTFEASYATGNTVVQYRRLTSPGWTTLPGTATSPVTVAVHNFISGNYNFRIYDTDNDISSNTEHAVL